MTLLTSLPTCLVGVLAATSPGALPAQDAPTQLGPSALAPITWAECSACHATPDARIEHDARWIGLNGSTTCLTGEAAKPINRKRLIAFLKEGQAPVSTLIRRVDGNAASADAGARGELRVPGTSGSAFLRRKRPEEPAEDSAGEPAGDPGPHKDETGSADGTLRLYWEAADEASTLSVPLGSYELVGYCFYREDEVGRKWTASATVQEGTRPDAFEVTSAGMASLPIEPKMFHDLSATSAASKLDVTFQMRNEAGDRMTLTRDGDLVEPTWVIYDVAGAEELASGRFVPS